MNDGNLIQFRVRLSGTASLEDVFIFAEDWEFDSNKGILKLMATDVNGDVVAVAIFTDFEFVVIDKHIELSK